MKTPRIVLLLSGLLAALATSKAPIDSGDSDPDDTAVAATCANTAVESCEDQGCALIRARELQDDGDGGVCVDWSDERGPPRARPGARPRPPPPPLAAPADDPTDCWWFSNLCLPEGWVSCESTEYGECS
jgi:hypothetical protein